MNPMMRCALFLMLIATCVRGDDVKARVNFGNYGSLDLSETTGGVKITARLTNLPAGQHGFHVHQSGDIYTDGCLSTGGHFNPDKVTFSTFIAKELILKKHIDIKAE